ncbi:MAG: hypothetical protein ACYC3N_00555, partial [Halothiobacillus sp.]
IVRNTGKSLLGLGFRICWIGIVAVRCSIDKQRWQLRDGRNRRMYGTTSRTLTAQQDVVAIAKEHCVGSMA